MEYLEGTALDKLSRFCFGCEQLGGVDWGEVDVRELELAIGLALTRGINFFDTAAIYGLGRSEERLTRALGNQKFNVTVATKGGLKSTQTKDAGRATITRDSSASAIARGVASSLDRLELQTLPIYYVHWPDVDTPFEETMTALMEMKESGRVEHIGLSNFDADQIRTVRRYGDVDIVQVGFSLLNRESRPVVEYCSDEGIPVCAYGVLAQGLLSGKYTSNSDFSAQDRRHRLKQFSPGRIEENLLIVDRLSMLANEIKREPVQIAIRYALQYAGISSVVVGIKSRAQLVECIDVFSWALSDEEIAFLEEPTGIPDWQGA